MENLPGGALEGRSGSALEVRCGEQEATTREEGRRRR
jgi:hypothetical protein